MAPMIVPTIDETTTTMMPTCSEIRAPKTTREKISRPVESVPNQWVAEGDKYLSAMSVVPTSYWAIQGANSATITSTTTIAIPIVVRRFIKNIANCRLPIDDWCCLES